MKHTHVCSRAERHALWCKYTLTYVLQMHKASDNESLQTVIGDYQTILKEHTNAKNLKKFVQSFLK